MAIAPTLGQNGSPTGWNVTFDPVSGNLMAGGRVVSLSESELAALRAWVTSTAGLDSVGYDTASGTLKSEGVSVTLNQVENAAVRALLADAITRTEADAAYADKATEDLAALAESTAVQAKEAVEALAAKAVTAEVNPVTGVIRKVTAGARDVAADLGLNAPRLHKALWPSPSAPAPTFATSGPGGASPVTGTFYRYDNNSFNFIGAVPVVVNALGTNYAQNQAAGSSGSGATAHAVEFGNYGADMAVVFRNNVATQSYFWVWATDPDTGVLRPQTAGPVASTANAQNSMHYYRVTFGSTSERVVRVYCWNADFGGIYLPNTSTIFKVQKPIRSLCVISDSYGFGTGANDQISGFAVTLGRLLDAETYINAVGGTGYVAVNSGLGGNNNFSAPARVAAAIATGATDFLIAGSINDKDADPIAVAANATSLVTQVRAALPLARIWVAGVQALPSSAATTGNNAANNTALASACAALGVPFISELAESWYTGTGKQGATTGDGNRDLFVWTDGVHPSQGGHDNRAARLYADLIALGW